MSWLSSIFEKRPVQVSEKSDSRYRNIERALKASGLNKGLVKVFYIDGFAYNNADYEKSIVALEKGKLSSFFREVVYDTQRDNIEMYMLEYKEERQVIFVFDPFEVYQATEILKVLPLYDIEQIEMPLELIYP